MVQICITGTFFCHCMSPPFLSPSFFLQGVGVGVPTLRPSARPTTRCVTLSFARAVGRGCPLPLSFGRVMSKRGESPLCLLFLLPSG